MALTFRFAQETDTLLILQFIRELADYEHLLDQVVADEATLRDQLFEKRRAEVLFALEDGAEVGFACFFKTSPPSWAGRACIWRTCMSGRSTGEGDMARLSSGGWRPSPRSGTAAAWSGGAGIGTPPASASTSPWGRRPWRTGPFTALPDRHCRGWQNRNLRLRKPMRFDILESH